MTQTSTHIGARKTIDIPFAFEFRTTKVRWKKAIAHLTGWARRSDSTLDGSNLVAVISPDGVQYPIRYSRHRLPEGKWDNLWVEAFTDADVQRVLAAFEPLLLVPTGKTHAGGPDFKKHSHPADAWLLREELLRLPSDHDSVLAFLNRWGRWNASEYIENSEVLRLQQAVRDGLTDSPGKWFRSPYSFPPTWDRSDEYPFFTFLTDQCEIAIRLTVTIDLLKGVPFRRCARPDCGQPFAVATHHDKKFCSRECGHLEAVRRSRKKAMLKPQGVK